MPDTSATRQTGGRSITSCVDLEQQFGRRYRIGWEDGGSTKALTPREEWPWIRQIECRYGCVYPFGDDVLTAVTDRPRIGTRLRALPFVVNAQGDEEVVVRFHVDHVAAVLAILKPYRRRQRLSEAQRAALDAGRRPFQRRNHVENDAETGLESSEAARGMDSDGKRFLDTPRLRLLCERLRTATYTRERRGNCGSWCYGFGPIQHETKLNPAMRT